MRGTQHPRYNATLYKAISDTTLIFLGSQIIFLKYLWGSADVSQLKVLNLYNYCRILSKIFSLDDKTDVGSVQETNVSSRLPKIHAFLG